MKSIKVCCALNPGSLLICHSCSYVLAVTGPVARFARQIAGHGFIVAAPSSYHDFVGPDPLKYDVEDTDRGNRFKIEKTLESYDEDSRKTVDYLLSLNTCTGRIGSTGMCLGGHLAVRASVCLPLAGFGPSDARFSVVANCRSSTLALPPVSPTSQPTFTPHHSAHRIPLPIQPSHSSPPSPTQSAP